MVRNIRSDLLRVFPWLRRLRAWQRTALFYAGMAIDHRRYARTRQRVALPAVVYGAVSTLYNPDTGFDMIYQENKVYNLRLATETMEGLLIRPGETFSFWQTVPSENWRSPYREGLTIEDGELVTAKGGGLCQLSNLLFLVFLHSPLTVVERHPHGVKHFPDAGGVPAGVDATVAEGWLDLKVTNHTSRTFQLTFDFIDGQLSGHLLADEALSQTYAVTSGQPIHYHRSQEIRQRVDVYRRTMLSDGASGGDECLLYTNDCRIGYALPASTVIEPAHGEPGRAWSAQYATAVF